MVVTMIIMVMTILAVLVAQLTTFTAEELAGVDPWVPMEAGADTADVEAEAKCEAEDEVVGVVDKKVDLTK